MKSPLSRPALSRADQLHPPLALVLPHAKLVLIGVELARPELEAADPGTISSFNWLEAQVWT
jgi:hypothetical protein